MRIASCWKDFEILDATAGQKLERWADITLIRPDPQVIWNSPQNHRSWKAAHASYHRSNAGGGQWEMHKPVPDQWTVGYRELKFIVRPTGFKHTGLFPEQAANWDLLDALLGQTGLGMNVLNMFAYTGGATLACAARGAKVCHLDASKGMVAWASQNAEASGLKAKPIRWMVEDCRKFVAREIRRGQRYDGIIMDPPSYGRGPGGEVWKLEDNIYALLDEAAALLDSDSQFFLLNSYTAGLSPSVMKYLLELLIIPRLGGKVICYELGLPVAATGGVLPCGGSALWLSENINGEALN
ncbi:MAG: class I SAM-dependent methyltransferase [Oscillospiraceae bacterium]|nr:class I SAM-dependent methyltransferase [Oscillospiraceae bacterium]